MNKSNNIANLNRKQGLFCFLLFHLYGSKTNQNTNLRISVEAMRLVGFRASFPSIGYCKFLKATDIQSVIIGMHVISIETRPITSGIGLITSGSGPITSGIRPITSGIGPIASGIRPITGGSGTITSGIRPFTSGIVLFTTSNLLFTHGIVFFTTSNLPVTSGFVPFTSSMDPMTSGRDRVRFVSEKIAGSILNLQMLQTTPCFKFQKNILFLSQHKY